jgi:hypothetical protein
MRESVDTDAERVRAELLLDIGQGRMKAVGRSRLNDVIERWLDRAGAPSRDRRTLSSEGQDAADCRRCT